MFQALRSPRSKRARQSIRLHLRALFRKALFAGLGIAASLSSTSCLLAQDTDNSATKSFTTNAVENAATGSYNNLSTGVLNFNGPAGAAEWSAQSGQINNAGTVNLHRAGLGIIGDVANTGTFSIGTLGGIIQVDGHFVNSGNGSVQILGGGVELIGDAGGGFANFTNNTTSVVGLNINANRYLVADTITNATGATMVSKGRLEGRTAIVNNGTIDSKEATSILKGNVTNNGTINAAGVIEGNVTHSATSSFNLKGNLTQTGNITNEGTLTVSDGNLTGTSELTNTSTITIANNRTLSAADIKNNTGGTISIGDNALLSGAMLENNATIIVGAGGTLRSTSTTADEDLTNSEDGVISFNGTTGTASLSSGTGKIVNAGTINLNEGTVLVTGNLTGAGTVEIADDVTFKTGSADQTIANTMNLEDDLTFDTNGFDATVSGNMTGTSDGGLKKAGLGNLTLEGTNTFSGATAINAGQLTLKGGSALSDSSAVTVGAAGKLKIENTETIGSLAGAAGSETNLVEDLTTGGNNASTTYSGKIVGDGKLTKVGTGTMTLAGTNANTYSGGITVENGTLVASTNEQLGTGAVTIGLDGNGEAGTLQINSGKTQTVDDLDIEGDSAVGAPKGVFNNSGTLSSTKNISNRGTINNQGTINASSGVTSYGGTINNSTATSVINGRVDSREGVTNNSGAIHGGVINSGTLNSDTGTSVITGGLSNSGEANLRNQVHGAIVNEDKTSSSGPATPAIITVTGDVVGNSTLQNRDTSKVHVKDGNFTGITTLTNESTHEAGVQIDANRTLGAAAVVNRNGSTIENSGTLQSGSAISNSGTITNKAGATVAGGINNAHAGSLVTNDGTINGGITQNFGTVNSLQSGSVINGGVNNSAHVNARGQINGAIVNNAQHTFSDVTLSHVGANAAGTVTFGTGPTLTTFDLAADTSISGSQSNGVKTVAIVFNQQDPLAGTSTYDPANNTITVYVEDGSSTTVQDIQDAIADGSGFTASRGASSGALTDTVNGNGQATLSGGRDSGTAVIRVKADATGSALQNKQITISEDDSIPLDSAVASVDQTTGNIIVKVRGDVSYADIAEEIDTLPGFNATVAASMGDQGYKASLDTPPTASTLTNGVFNVQGDLVANSTFTNVGHLNLNDGDLTGVTTLTNTGEVAVKNANRLEAATINNNSGTIALQEDTVLHSTTATNNSAEIKVNGLGDITSAGTITNNATGKMTFGLGTTSASDVSELKSATNSIVNNGQIDVTNGVLLTTGNVSGNGSIALGDGTTFRSGNDNQTIANSMTIASGSANFDTDGKNANISGAISGSGEFRKLGTGNLALSGTNTFTGPAVIDDGQLTLSGGSAIADSTNVQLNSGSLTVSTAETIGSLTTAIDTLTTLNANLSTGGNNTSTTSSGKIAGTAGLVKQGTGTMTLDGSVANTYAGGTTVSGGSLVAATDEQLGTGSVSVLTGANLTTAASTTQTVAGLNNQGTVSLGSSSTFNTGSAHFNNSGIVEVGTDASIIDSGLITNSGSINFAGGTATFSSGTDSITNSGNINLNAGTLVFKGNIAGNGAINMNDGTTLQSGNANQQIANSIKINGPTASIDSNGNNLNVTGNISGAGTLSKVGAGNLTLSGINTFAGPAVIDNGQLILSGGSAIADSTDVDLNMGSLIVSTAETIGSLDTLSGTTTTLNATLSTGGNNSNTTSSGVITGTAGLVKQGTGTMTLDGSSANTHAGGTTVSGGSLVASTDEQLGTGSVSVQTGANLTTAASTTQTVAGLSNQGTVTLGNSSTFSTGSAHFNNSGTVEVGTDASIIDSGLITNSGAINFAGGTATLSSGTDSITNTGNINLNVGTLVVKGNIAGNGAINMNDGTTLRSGNANQQIANSIKINGASALIDTNGNDLNLTGSTSGSGSLNKIGAGNLTLSGTNAFTGPVEIDGGQLTLSGGNAIADSTDIELNSGSLTVSTAETIGSLTTATDTLTTLNATLTTGGNNSNSTSSGVIAGTAGLIKKGTGTMTLDGMAANTYAGGTTVSMGTLNASTNEQLGTGIVTVATGATLSTGDNTTQSVSGLNNQGTLALGNSATLNTGANHFNNSGTVNVGASGSIIDSGAITNSGTINFTGGTATLSSGTNSITNTGSINLNAGTVLVKGNLIGGGSINMNDGTTLQSGSANQQIANGISVNSGTAIIDTNGNNVNLTGTISGLGNLNKIGIGTLTWVGINNGNALVDSGVMVTSTQNQVGNIQITNGSGVIFNQHTAGTYAGSVSGNGTLTKDGSGIVTLTGNSAYTGGTNVVGGTLRVGSNGIGQVESDVNVGSNGTLGGSGTIVGNVATQRGGRIAAGNSIGTLNITGDLNAVPGSTIENELNGTQSDLINVTGVAAISGVMLENQFDPTATYTTRMYRALNATGGVSGRFSSVNQVNPPSNFLISTYYTPTTANVVLTSMADATLASSVSTSLLSSGQDYLSTIMDQVNGYQLGGLGLLASNSPEQINRNVWFKGVGFFSNVNAVGAAPGYSANTGGGIVGVDRAASPFTRFGVSAGYTSTDLGMRNAARSGADIDSARLNLYAAHSWELVTLSAIGGYAHHDMDSERRLIGIGTALGSQSQNETSAIFQITVNPTGDVHRLLPYFGMQWVQLSQGAYTEQGTPGFDMAFRKANVDSLRPYVGTRYQYRMLSSSGLLAVPYLSARYIHETIMDSNLTSLSINGSEFTVAGVQPNRSIVGLGGGINAQLRHNIDWYASYNLDLGNRSTNQNAAAGLGFKF